VCVCVCVYIKIYIYIYFCVEAALFGHDPCQVVVYVGNCGPIYCTS